jgi:uncharacterized protein YkwD
MKKFIAVVALVLMVSANAEARRYRVTRTTQQYTYGSQGQLTQYSQTVETSDVSGFCQWLNSYRARHGLGAVSVDANLNGWAYQNSLAQTGRGLGHFIMGIARRQNSGMGPYQTVVQMWTQSGAHNAALLDPTITTIGIAQAGNYWTFNAR